MATSIPVSGAAPRASEAPGLPRHSVLVRVTHWTSAAAALVLVISGITILLAHPRLYWGETGAVGGPSLVDLPLPWVLDVPIRGPGRYLHFLAAWVIVATGLVYVAASLIGGHAARDLLPRGHQLNGRALWAVMRGHLRFERPTDEALATYNPLQRVAYTAVVFVLFPLVIWTGLAMSPAVTSVAPFLVTLLGGQQSARTVHFAVACAVVLFVVGHIAMVWRSGFRNQMRAMTGLGLAGRRPAEQERR